MQAIITKYHGATNFKPSRVSATTGTGHRRVMLSYDHGLDIEGNHRAAAKALCAEMGWKFRLIGGETKAGFVWVMVPRRAHSYFTVAPAPAQEEPEPFTYMDTLQGATRYSAECVRDQSHVNDGDDVCTRCGANLNG